MFGRKRAARDVPPPVLSGATLGYRQVIGLEAEPDVRNIQRDRGLRWQIGRTLQGDSGAVIDYDRGDPAHSLEAVVPPRTTPTQAIAQVSRIQDQAVIGGVPEISGVPMTDPNLDPYAALQWWRAAR